MAERTLNECHQSRLNLGTVTQDKQGERVFQYITVYSINYKAVTELKRAYKECLAN